MRLKSTYVLYRGDELLDIGTADELAERRGVTTDTIRFYATKTYQSRGMARDRLRAVRVNDDRRD